MLDWRGLVGTMLVHATAALGWPASEIWPTTMCLCWSPSEDVTNSYDAPESRQIRLLAYADPPTGLVTVPYTQRSACQSPPDRAPVLLWHPAIPQRLRSAGSVAFCASVRPDGSVSGLTLLRSSDRPRRDVAEVRRLIRQARFAPSRQSARVEIALTS